MSLQFKSVPIESAITTRVATFHWSMHFYKSSYLVSNPRIGGQGRMSQLSPQALTFLHSSVVNIVSVSIVIYLVEW